MQDLKTLEAKRNALSYKLLGSLMASIIVLTAPFLLVTLVSLKTPVHSAVLLIVCIVTAGLSLYFIYKKHKKLDEEIVILDTQISILKQKYD